MRLATPSSLARTYAKCMVNPADMSWSLCPLTARSSASLGISTWSGMGHYKLGTLTFDFIRRSFVDNLPAQGTDGSQTGTERSRTGAQGSKSGIDGTWTRAIPLLKLNKRSIDSLDTI